MANPTKDFQGALLVLDGLLCVLVAACLMYLVSWIAARLARYATGTRAVSAGARGALGSGRAHGRAWSRPVRLGLRAPLSTLGVITAIASPAAAYRHAPAAPSWRASDGAAPPWSATSGFPPPRPLVRIRAPERAEGHTATRRLADGGDRRDDDDRSRATTPGYTLRGVRDARGGMDAANDRPGLADTSSPGRRPYERADDRAARARAMAEHPAGKGWGAGCPSLNAHHVVVAGDTLWDIAAAVLGTTDPARVARYWPRIHRNNREIIGPDPSLIYPGSVLVLPPECPE